MNVYLAQDPIDHLFDSVHIPKVDTSLPEPPYHHWTEVDRTETDVYFEYDGNSKSDLLDDIWVPISLIEQIQGKAASDAYQEGQEDARVNLGRYSDE